MNLFQNICCSEIFSIWMTIWYCTATKLHGKNILLFRISSIWMTTFHSTNVPTMTNLCTIEVSRPMCATPTIKKKQQIPPWRVPNYDNAMLQRSWHCKSLPMRHVAWRLWKLLLLSDQFHWWALRAPVTAFACSSCKAPKKILDRHVR